MVRACLSKCQGFFHPPTWIDRYNHQLTNIIFSRGSITNLVMSPPRREGFKIIFLLPPGHDWIVFSFLMRWAWGWGLGLGDWGWGLGISSRNYFFSRLGIWYLQRGHKQWATSIQQSWQKLRKESESQWKSYLRENVIMLLKHTKAIIFTTHRIE